MGPVIPVDAATLNARIQEISNHYAPFLRSLPPPLKVRQPQPLAAGWLSKFEVSPTVDLKTSMPDKWEQPGLNDSDWEPVTVPEWRYNAVDVKKPTSCILWYRTHFETAAAEPGQRVFIVFPGVEWEAEVFLNGHRLGGHVGYYEAFRIDATDYLQRTNVLAVRLKAGPGFGEPHAYAGLMQIPTAAEQRYVTDPAKSLAGFTHVDLQTGTGYGIFRPVHLERTGSVAVNRILARARPDAQTCTVQVDLDARQTQPVQVKVELLPENFSGPAFSKTTEVTAGVGVRGTAITLPTPAIPLWTPDAPRLYRCRVTVAANGKILDAADVLTGARTFGLVSESHPQAGLSPGTFLFNGEPFRIRGSNLQGENIYTFWQQPEKLKKVLLMVKAGGFNAIRSIQHLEFPEVREMCDRLGILSQQDVGSQFPKEGKQCWDGWLAAAAQITRECYNNPGVVLISFANESHFNGVQPLVQAALREDPERILVPISGHWFGMGKYSMPKGCEGYDISDTEWANVVQDFHNYPGWYIDPGKPWEWGKLFPAGRLMLKGEYGGEALDGYETMARNYPSDWKVPAKTSPEIFGEVQCRPDDLRMFIGNRGHMPANLGEYITASQRYQADILNEMTTVYRLSPDRISGYFQFHFIDTLPANWPKAIVSHDFTPKLGYYAMAQVNQPLVPLPRLLPGGNQLQLWVANDYNRAFPQSRLRWEVFAKKGDTVPLQSGEVGGDIPQFNAVQLSTADVSTVSADLKTVEIRLTLMDHTGQTLSTFEQEFYLEAWRQMNALLPHIGEKKDVTVSNF